VPPVRREGEEEGVALGIDLDTALCGTRLPHDPPVLGECPRIRVGAELVQELGRALDVGKEEGDGASRKIASACDHATHSAAGPAPVAPRLTDAATRLLNPTAPSTIAICENLLVRVLIEGRSRRRRRHNRDIAMALVLLALIAPTVPRLVAGG
jgi:hypothetical protein